jgi:hypothetical protein
MSQDTTKPIKPTSTVKRKKPQQVQGWEEDPALTVNSISRAKKILNRSRLKQSILVHEILHRKY